MSFHDCLVVERANDWWIVAGSHSESLALHVSPAELVTCAKLMMQLSEVKKPSCVLAPASTSCFFATLHAGEELDVRDRAALTYELEDHLPIDAESMVADFVVIPPSVPGGSSADRPSPDKLVAAVAVEFNRWRQMADAFEAAGIPVRSIVPAAVLASRSACRDLDFTQTIDLWLVDGTQCDMITIERDTIAAWKHGCVDAGMLRRHRLLDAADSQRVVVVGAEQTQQSTIQDVYGDAEFATESIESHLVRGAQLCLAGQSQHWFDLRREQLGPSDRLRPIRREMRLVTFAAAACLLAMVVGGWWRTQRIETEIASVRLKQQELFQAAFPGTQVPGAIVRRVRSEHARVMGSRGASTLVDVPKSAPDILRELLAALPENVRFRIDSIQILNGQVNLDLQVRSPVDAGVLATSLSSAGFLVDPPVTTQKDAKTFESVLEAQWVGSLKAPATRRDVSVRISILREVAG